MTDKEELRRLAQAVAGWSNCNKAWLDTSEDVAAAVVGHIDEDGNTYPVVTVDCELYYSGDSLALAKFYAAANPAAVIELLDEIERLQSALSEIGMTPDEARAGVALNRAACTTLSADQGDE